MLKPPHLNQLTFSPVFQCRTSSHLNWSDSAAYLSDSLFHRSSPASSSGSVLSSALLRAWAAACCSSISSRCRPVYDTTSSCRPVDSFLSEMLQRWKPMTLKKRRTEHRNKMSTPGLWAGKKSCCECEGRGYMQRAGYLTGPKLKVMKRRTAMTQTALLLLAESLPWRRETTTECVSVLHQLITFTVYMHTSSSQCEHVLQV